MLLDNILKVFTKKRDKEVLIAFAGGVVRKPVKNRTEYHPRRCTCRKCVISRSKRKK